jgi:hypothetical protein
MGDQNNEKIKMRTKGRNRTPRRSPQILLSVPRRGRVGGAGETISKSERGVVVSVLCLSSLVTGDCNFGVGGTCFSAIPSPTRSLGTAVCGGGANSGLFVLVITPETSMLAGRFLPILPFPCVMARALSDW